MVGLSRRQVAEVAVVVQYAGVGSSFSPLEIEGYVGALGVGNADRACPSEDVSILLRPRGYPRVVRREAAGHALFGDARQRGAANALPAGFLPGHCVAQRLAGRSHQYVDVFHDLRYGLWRLLAVARSRQHLHYHAFQPQAAPGVEKRLSNGASSLVHYDQERLPWLRPHAVSHGDESGFLQARHWHIPQSS